MTDINFYSSRGRVVEHMFPEHEIDERSPRRVAWHDRTTARSAFAKALACEGATVAGSRSRMGQVR